MPEPMLRGANGSGTGISLETPGRFEQPSFADRLPRKSSLHGRMID